MKAAVERFLVRGHGVFAAVLLGLACAGCASTAQDAATAGSRGPIDTGTYPNLNVPPPVATKQFDSASLEAHKGALGDARKGQDAQGRDAARIAAAARAEQKRLRRLAASIQADTVKAIEGSSRAGDQTGAVRRLRDRQARENRTAATQAASSRAEQERLGRLAAESRKGEAAQGAADAAAKQASDGALRRARRSQAELGAGDGKELSPAERERRRKRAAARQAELLKAIEQPR